MQGDEFIEPEQLKRRLRKHNGKIERGQKYECHNRMLIDRKRETMLPRLKLDEISPGSLISHSS
jgi:hypothetical protein